MKISVYAVGLISLTISLFSSYANADGVTQVRLSTAPSSYHVHNAGLICSLPRHPIRHHAHVYRGKTLWVTPHRTMYKKKRIVRKHMGRVRVGLNHKRANRAKRAHRKNMRNKKWLRANKMRSYKKIAKRKHLRNKYVPRYHHVKRGDNLYVISKRYGVTVAHIISVNKLRTKSIKVGIRLKI